MQRSLLSRNVIRVLSILISLFIVLNRSICCTTLNCTVFNCTVWNRTILNCTIFYCAISNCPGHARLSTIL